MIHTRNLEIRYGPFQAVKGLNLDIPEGTVYGFVGPNGAGKSTTMLVLATLLAPTKGQAQVGGYDVVEQPERVRELIGYMPDFFGVYDKLTVCEYLDFYAGAHAIPIHERRDRIEDLLDLVDLAHKGESYVDSLSRGMKQRLGLARALLHDPKVLILDEPASGLDPRARMEMKRIIKGLKAQGKTVLISSHILPELAEMCDQIGILEQGQLVAQAPVSEIAAQVAGHRKLKICVLDLAEEAKAQIHYLEHVQHVEVEAHQLTVTYTGDEQGQAEILARLVKNGIPVYGFAEEAGNLEEVFLTVTKGVGS